MKAGLLLVDIQNEYFPGNPMELVGIEEASIQAGELLSFFRKKQWPVFHIQHVIPNEKSPIFALHSRGVEIHESVQPLDSEKIIIKNYANSFRETTLLEGLRKSGVARVVVCGAMSHMCVEATTRAAADLGFDCIVIHDACATMNLVFGDKTIKAEDVHGSSMAALGFAYAKVMSVTQYIGSMRNDSAT
jgi:nicotinamidase-related amidase